jgi:hypothetical protein
MKNSINREFRSLSEFKKYFYPEPIESLILDPEELGAKLAKEVLAHSDKIMQNLGIPKHLLEGQLRNGGDGSVVHMEKIVLEEHNS